MRFSLFFALAVACSHASPPAAVSTNTEPGLSKAPAAVSQAGEPAVAGKPPAVPEDLVSPITAAGRDFPVGLDWGEKGNLPASQLGFKNVKILGGVSGNRMMAAMQSTKANFGVKCIHCHAVEKRDWGSDEKEPKNRAREMIDMTTRINAMLFEGKPEVTCWMCHRGEVKPAKPENFPRDTPANFPKLSEEDAKKPAAQVFKNMKSLGEVPAGRLGMIMTMFSASLGVKCTGCHVKDDFASDAKKEKLLAREMLKMTGMVGKNFYAGKNSPVFCWTCHRGEEAPKARPDVAFVDPDDAKPRGG